MAYIKKNPHEGHTVQISFTLFVKMEIHICQNTITNMQFKYLKKLANSTKKKNLGKEQAFFLVSVNHNHMPTDHTAQHNM